MIEIFDNDNGYLICFNGEPDQKPSYDKLMKELIKNRTYDQSLGGWIVPDLKELGEYFYLEPEEELADIGSTMKLTPYPYQKEAIQFCLANKQALLVLPCGAGKTTILIGTYVEALRRGYITGPGMVVVKASLKEQWHNEIGKFSDLTSIIVQSRSSICSNINNRIKAREKKMKTANADKAALKAEIKALEKEADELFNSQFKGYDLYVLNYEALCDQDIRMAMHKLKPQAVLSDESHYIKNYDADRSKALYEFAQAEFRIESTATPIQKNYEDVYGLFKLLKPDYWPNFSRFAGRYISYAGFGRIAGFKHVEELREKISPNIFIKLKEEISDQLPKLQVIQRHCVLDSKVQAMSDHVFEELKELKDASDALRSKCKSEKEVRENQELQVVEAKIMALQTFAQELADDPRLLELSESSMSKEYAVKAKSNPKLEMLKNLIAEIVESGEKVAIFCRFERMQQLFIEMIAKIDKSIKVAYINGTMNTEKRYEEVYTKFRDTDNYKVLLLTDAGAEGLNLSRCKYLIEYDLAESYAIQTQRHGRVERADSIHDNVVVYQLIAQDSWDEVAQKIVEKKEGFDYELIKSLKE